MAERERDLDRLLTFIDAVVAIAITLLILPLAEIGKEVRTGLVGELLRQHANDLIGFFLSFAVIARLWLAQHNIVSCVVRQSRAVVLLLFAWTLTIVFLPFPTTLVASTLNDGTAKTLYIGTMALSSTMLALLARAIGRDRSLRDVEEAPDVLDPAGTAIAFLPALAISVAFPALGYWPLLLLLVVERWWGGSTAGAGTGRRLDQDAARARGGRRRPAAGSRPRIGVVPVQARGGRPAAGRWPNRASGTSRPPT